MTTDNPNPTPLSTYTERLPQVKRVFRLYKDRVEIDASWTIGKDYQTTVRLEDLSWDIKQITIRNRWFKKSIMIGSLAVAVAVVFTRGDYPQFVKNTAMLGWGVAIFCMIIAFRSFTKRHFARFARNDGKPGLDICDSGPDRARFGEFVREVQRRIRNA
jgi:hypothetical protein